MTVIITKNEYQCVLLTTVGKNYTVEFGNGGGKLMMMMTTAFGGQTS